MKKVLLILVVALTSSCASQKGEFYDARIRYNDPSTEVSDIVPAVVYVKKGKIKSIIVVE